ncbi:MAG: response regulator [Planctomycetaceae bacterium]
MMTGKILIADDDLDLGEALAMRCEAAGLECIVVDNAESALLAVAGEHPDLVILDLIMPTPDGVSVFDILATRYELAEVPVIILTGCEDDETVRECQFLMAHYVHKGPNLWPRLRRVLSEYLSPGWNDEPASSRRHETQLFGMLY